MKLFNEAGEEVRLYQVVSEVVDKGIFIYAASGEKAEERALQWFRSTYSEYDTWTEGGPDDLVTDTVYFKDGLAEDRDIL